MLQIPIGLMLSLAVLTTNQSTKFATVRPADNFKQLRERVNRRSEEDHAKFAQAATRAKQLSLKKAQKHKIKKPPSSNFKENQKTNPQKTTLIVPAGVYEEPSIWAGIICETSQSLGVCQ